MQKKIRLLLVCVKMYEEYLFDGREPKHAIEKVRDFLLDVSDDKILPEQIIKSFKDHINNDHSPKEWLKQELQEFGIFLADEKYQKINIPKLNSMSFIYHFLMDKEDDFFCDHSLPRDKRILKFCEKADITSLENLQPGNIIVYNYFSVITHIALYLGKINGLNYAISKFGPAYGVYLHPIDRVVDGYGVPEFYNLHAPLSANAVTKIAEVNQFIVDWNYTTSLTFNEFKARVQKYFLDCGFFRQVQKDKITENQNNPYELKILYQNIIEPVKKQNQYYESMLRIINHFGDDGEVLKSRITNELARQKKYLEHIESQLESTQHLIRLLGLNAEQLFEEAKNNKSSVLLIIKTPQLFTQISVAQMEFITHQDPEIIKRICDIVSLREYTSEVVTSYKSLKKQLTTDTEREYIATTENAAIRSLLLKIDNYLDEKLKPSTKANTYPWSLGYFGSRHKVKSVDGFVAVPQGIFEIKAHLALIDTTPPIEILDKIQATLKTKLDEIHDESFFAQVKRFVSYLLGYQRSENTIKEYNHLDELVSGIHP